MKLLVSIHFYGNYKMPHNVLLVQSNSNGSNIFGTMEFCWFFDCVGV